MRRGRPQELGGVGFFYIGRWLERMRTFAQTPFLVGISDHFSCQLNVPVANFSKGSVSVSINGQGSTDPPFMSMEPKVENCNNVIIAHAYFC